MVHMNARQWDKYGKLASLLIALTMKQLFIIMTMKHFTLRHFG